MLARGQLRKSRGEVLVSSGQLLPRRERRTKRTAVANWSEMSVREGSSMEKQAGEPFPEVNALL